MRIGVDATPLQQLHGGISYYTFFLLDELIQIRENDTFFLFNNKITDHLEHFRKYKNVRIATYPPSFVGHSIWAQTLLSYGCWIEKIDLFWGTTQSIPLFKRSSTKTILTLHDFVYLICPETTSLFKKIYLKLLCRKMLQKADIILPVSAGTGSKLQRFYNIDYHSIISPPLKPQMTFEQTSRHNFKKYLVVIGTLEPRKNLQSLIDVYLEMLKNYPAEDILPLVIIGGGGWKNKKLIQNLAQAKASYPNHFHLMGYIPDSEIASFLSGARYCLMVSKYEGYGMPIAESRMCRTPVICLDTPEMREAAENDGYFLSENNWREEIQPYILASSQIQYIDKTSYLSNKDKAFKISKTIDSLYRSSYI